LFPIYVLGQVIRSAAQQLPVLSGWLSSQLCVPGLEGGS
jgi:hypothetical protein